MLPVTIWMNMPSFYQNDLFCDLAKKVDLRVVYDHGMTGDRRELGWSEPSGEYKTCVLESDQKIRHAMSIARSELDRVHIINGIWAESAFMAAAFVLGRASARFSIYAECPDDTVRRSVMRRGARAVAGHWVAGRASGMFAVSHFAVDYFAALGFRRECIYPFGYFRSTPRVKVDPSRETANLVYIGQLVHRKGIDILLQAVAPIARRFPDMRLSVIGMGPEYASISAKVRENGLANHVMFEGVKPSAHIHERLQQASVLILPSRWDGWGLVINEALAAGIPVIASDRCGAADLIVSGMNGYVFRSESVDSLRSCISAFLESDRAQMRAAALKTSSALTIPVVSDYFVDCLEHMCGQRNDKPAPPWQEALSCLQSEVRGISPVDQTSRPDFEAKQKSA
jgi:glycosyltransferase involved in cell wall biosynthesis